MSSKMGEFKKLKYKDIQMYLLFLSRTWEYKNQLEELKNILCEGLPGWQDTSVPFDDPVHFGNPLILKGAIEKRIYKSDCLIIQAGIYLVYNKWIKYEVDAAKRFGKPIILVEIFKNKKSSDYLLSAVNKITNFSSEGIITAINDLCRKKSKN